MMNVLVGLGGLRREVQAEVEGENSVRHVEWSMSMRCGVMVGLLCLYLPIFQNFELCVGISTDHVEI